MIKSQWIKMRKKNNGLRCGDHLDIHMSSRSVYVGGGERENTNENIHVCHKPRVFTKLWLGGGGGATRLPSWKPELRMMTKRCRHACLYRYAEEKDKRKGGKPGRETKQQHKFRVLNILVRDKDVRFLTSRVGRVSGAGQVFMSALWPDPTASK